MAGILPFIFDTKETLIISLGENGTRETEFGDDIYLSYSTSDVELKLHRLKLKMKTIAKKIGKLMKSPSDKLPSIYNLIQSAPKDIWGNELRLNVKKGIIYYAGRDQKSDPLLPSTELDDIKVAIPNYKVGTTPLLLKQIGLELFKYKMTYDKYPTSIHELKASGFCSNLSKYDEWDNLIIIDNSLVISSGYDGIKGTEDDLKFDSSNIGTSKRIQLTKEFVSKIAEKFTRFEYRYGTQENLLPLGYSGYEPNIFTMRDGWGNKFTLEGEKKERFILSPGPDGKHSPSFSRDWLDDITSECGIGSKIAKKLKLSITKRKKDRVDKSLLIKKSREEILELARKIRRRDRAIGRKKLIYKRLGNKLQKLLKKVRDPFGNKYRLNFKRKIISSAGPDKKIGTKDDISLCWRRVKLNKKNRHRRKRGKKRRK